MRIPINLASHPPENLRLLRTGVVVLGVTALLLGIVILRRESFSRDQDRLLIDRQAQLEERLRTLQSQQASLESDLSTPQAKQIREQSAFMNSLILQKGLSWTQIFMDLEQTLPAKAHIVSIRPSLNSAEDVDLSLTVAAGSIGPLAEFVKKLESSAQFGSLVLGGTHYGGGNRGNSDKDSGEITMDLTTRYRQDRAAAPAPTSALPSTATNQTPAPEELGGHTATEQASNPRSASGPAGKHVQREEAAR
jgi:hypothetical protein